MKLFCTFLFISLLFIDAFSQNDSTKHKLKAAGSASINSNGIAPVPAFSLDKPALIANVSLAKGRFSYEPAMAYSFELKPWYIDNWVNYRVINKEKFAFTVGFNASGFFSEDSSKNGKAIIRGERYFTFAFTGWFRITSRSTLTTAYWNDNGQDGGISGHFFSAIGERTNIMTGSKTFLNASVQLFYLNYDGNNDGLFITPRISFNIINFPLSAFILGTQPITSNIEPFPEFKWNIGLAYAF
jgi:hypothetical protein